MCKACDKYWWGPLVGAILGCFVIFGFLCLAVQGTGKNLPMIHAIFASLFLGGFGGAFLGAIFLHPAMMDPSCYYDHHSDGNRY
jgi:hypothetical protein